MINEKSSYWLKIYFFFTLMNNLHLKNILIYLILRQSMMGRPQGAPGSSSGIGIPGSTGGNVGPTRSDSIMIRNLPPDCNWQILIRLCTNRVLAKKEVLFCNEWEVIRRMPDRCRWKWVKWVNGLSPAECHLATLSLSGLQKSSDILG